MLKVHHVSVGDKGKGETIRAGGARERKVDKMAMRVSFCREDNFQETVLDRDGKEILSHIPRAREFQVAKGPTTQAHAALVWNPKNLLIMIIGSAPDLRS